jgi:O-antigen/teichoic acid export membrane protein
MTIFTLLVSVAALAALVKTLLYASLLEPDQFGLVGLSALIVSLTSYVATFGVQDGLAREVPIRGGRGEAVNELRVTALGAVFTVASVLGLAASIVLALGETTFGLPVGAWWIGPYITANVWLNITLVDLQIRQRSSLQALTLFMKSFSPFVVLLLADCTWTASRVIALESAVLFTLAVSVIVSQTRDLRLSFSREELTHLTRVGLPFVGGSLANNIAMNIDRWSVQLFLGTAALGLYMFAMQLVSAALVVVNVTQMYFTPRWLRAWSMDQGVLSLWKRTRQCLAIVGSLTAAVFLIVVLISPIAVNSLWPQYVDALPLLPWVAVASVAISVAFFDVFFIAANSGRKLLEIHLSVGLVMLAAVSYCVVAGAPLIAYAVTFAMGRVATMLLGWILGLAAVRAAGRRS